MKNDFKLKYIPLFILGISLTSIRAECEEFRIANHHDLELIESKFQKIEDLNEDELRNQLELQAAQIESGLQNAILEKNVLEESQIETIQEIANSIREEAAKPDLKKRMLLKKLLFLPRILAQGVGYAGMVVTDLVAIPIIVSSVGGYNMFAGDHRGIGIAFGIGAGMIGGMSMGLMELIILGYNFPIVMGSLIPVGLTMSMVCEDRIPESIHTRKFCANWHRNQDLLRRIGDRSANAGQAINRFFHPKSRPY